MHYYSIEIRTGTAVVVVSTSRAAPPAAQSAPAGETLEVAAVSAFVVLVASGDGVVGADVGGRGAAHVAHPRVVLV